MHRETRQRPCERFRPDCLGPLPALTPDYRETMRRRGFSPYGPSKAALESETIIWAQDLAGTGVTVNALLPGGASRTGMIPDEVPPELRKKLILPETMVAQLLWLVSDSADEVSGQRLDASRWDTNLNPSEAAAKACEPALWGAPKSE